MTFSAMLVRTSPMIAETTVSAKKPTAPTPPMTLRVRFGHGSAARRASSTGHSVRRRPICAAQNRGATIGSSGDELSKRRRHDHPDAERTDRHARREGAAHDSVMRHAAQVAEKFLASACSNTSSRASAAMPVRTSICWPSPARAATAARAASPQPRDLDAVAGHHAPRVRAAPAGGAHRPPTGCAPPVCPGVACSVRSRAAPRAPSPRPFARGPGRPSSWCAVSPVSRRTDRGRTGLRIGTGS